MNDKIVKQEAEKLLILDKHIKESQELLKEGKQFLITNVKPGETIVIETLGKVSIRNGSKATEAYTEERAVFNYEKFKELPLAARKKLVAAGVINIQEVTIAAKPQGEPTVAVFHNV